MNPFLKPLKLILSLFLFALTGIAQHEFEDIAKDAELPGRTRIVRRWVRLKEKDCLRVFQGTSCEVKTHLPKLIESSASLSQKSFHFSAGSSEWVSVTFKPSAEGYSITVFPGSVEGPYTSYLKKAFSSLPQSYEITGLQIELERDNRFFTP